MHKFIHSLHLNPLSREYVSLFWRNYRTGRRKKVSIELNKPSLYDDTRRAPSKLLKANLFTPESAGHRELPMLCFWIVNYGYADYSILTRYVQSAIDCIKKLRVKGIAIIFHSVSKYLYNNKITLVEHHDIADADAELRRRELLIKKCVHLVLEAHPLLPNLFVNAVPKDLGMIALSIGSVYEMFVNECTLYGDTDSSIVSNLAENNPNIAKSDNRKLRELGGVVNRLMQRLAQEIVPKLPFCEMEEFAAFAKSFSKINTDWSSTFLRELSLEVSSLLMEKIEDLELLRQNRFIGEDLVEELNKLPRDLSTITCSLSRCKVDERRFWERAQTLISLLVDVKNRDLGLKDADVTTLTLLCTSMINYTDVRPIVSEILKGASESDTCALVVGFNTSVKGLKDSKLAAEFLRKIDPSQLSNLNPKLLSRFILNFARGSFDNSRIREAILGLFQQDVDAQVLTSILIGSRPLKLGDETRSQIVQMLSPALGNLETHLLVSVLMNTIDSVVDDEFKGLCNAVLAVLYNRVDQIALPLLPTLLSTVLQYFPAHLLLVQRLCRRIDSNIEEFKLPDIASAADHMGEMGLNVNKLFSRNMGKIAAFKDTDHALDHPYSFDPGRTSTGEEAEELEIPELEGTTEVRVRPLAFTPNDSSEISKIAECALTKGTTHKVLMPEDFMEDPALEDVEFELVRYPSGQRDTLDEPGSTASDGPVSHVPSSSTVEHLKSAWAQARQTAQ